MNPKFVDEYSQASLAKIYDTLNPEAADTSFYKAIVQEFAPQKIVDVGCGTGLLTNQLASETCAVIGIEPAYPMLELAQAHDTKHQITWIHGTTADVKNECDDSDLVTMTGHVSQVFIDDQAWSAVLQDIHRFLKPGGHLVFEMRNPKVEPWKNWTEANSKRTLQDPHYGTITNFVQASKVQDNIVEYENVYQFHEQEQKEPLKAKSTLRFRTCEELQASLKQTGFTVQACYGDWDKSAFVAQHSHEIIIVARKD